MILMLKNIKSFLLHHKVIFAIFIISQMVSTLAVLYVTSVFQVSQIADREYADSLRTFTVVLDNSISSQELDEQLYTINAQYKGELRQLVIYSDDYGVKANYFYPPELYHFVKIGSYFAPLAFEMGTNQIILNEIFDFESYSIGDNYFVGGVSYTIVGIASNNDYNEIPYSALPDTLPISAIQLKTTIIPNKNQIESTLSNLSEIFLDDVSIFPPEEPDFNLLSQHNMEYMVCILIFLLSITNISYLFQFVLEKRKSQLAIFRACGCSKRKALCVYLGESIVLATGQFIICCLIIHFGISKVFSALNGSRTYSMGLMNYTVVYGCFLLLVLIVFFICVFRFVRQSISSML